MANHDFAAMTIRTCAGGYAGLTAERMLDQQPALAERYGDECFGMWKEGLRHQLLGLAAALHDNDAGMFQSRIHWLRASFESRQVPTQDLELALDCLHQVLTAELPPNCAEIAADFVHNAKDHLGEAPELPPTLLDASTVPGRLATRYVHELLEGNRTQAVSLLVDAVRDKQVTLRECYLDVLLAAQREMGPFVAARRCRNR